MHRRLLQWEEVECYTIAAAAVMVMVVGNGDAV